MTTTTMTTTQRLRLIERALNAMFPEREAFIRGMILATINRRHVLTLGPGGVAKTELIESFVNCIAEADTYNQQLHRTTTVEELVGDMDPVRYRNGEGYHRKTEGTLLDAEVAVLDEILEASGATLKGLLSLLEGGVFKDGDRTIEAKLRSVFGATNEMPADKALDAFYDRFLLRYFVDDLQDEQNVADVLWGDRQNPRRLGSKVNVTLAEVDEINARARKLPLSDEAKQAVLAMRRDLLAAGMRASVRRLDWSTGTCDWRTSLVQVNAALNDHAEVQVEDLQVLCDVLWLLPKQQEKVRAIVLAYAAPEVMKVRLKLDALLQAANLVTSRSKNKAKALELLNRAHGVAKLVEQLKPAPTEAAAVTKMQREIVDLKNSLAIIANQS